MPAQSAADKAIQTMQDLIHLIQNPTPATPFPTFGPEHTAAIQELATIFQTKIESPNTDITRVKNKRQPKGHKVPEPQPTPTHAAAANMSEQRTNQMKTGTITPATGAALEYGKLIADPETKQIWEQSAANEFGRLMNGVGQRMQQGTNTIIPIQQQDIPSGRKATYVKYVCNIRPQKTEKHRTRITVGGNLINYPGNTSTPTADMTTAKLLINSTISQPDAKWLGIDLKDFYLNTPMERREYITIPLNLIPDEIIQQYHLETYKTTNNNVYFEVQKGMYGLPQAGIIAHEQLKRHLSIHGYTPCRYTPGLWRHEHRDVQFCLVVDDFGVKYSNKQDALHLVNALKQMYETTLDWEGQLFCGIHLHWNYEKEKRKVRLSMPGYVQKCLQRFQHEKSKQQHAPYPWNEPAYGQRIQLTDEPDQTPPPCQHRRKPESNKS
jgi:hypothetical protein